jgi:hypothetical protein
VFHNAVSAYKNATVIAGERVDKKLVDMSLESGYMIMDAVAKTPQQAASEYYQIDWVIECLLQIYALLKHSSDKQVHTKLIRHIFTDSRDILLRWRGMLDTIL